ncbi:hypothetical protein M0R45_014671 [Rubus argutus]|uniref:Uncharacterized protein n=1 Tax=Rubus argutus TaxID=59490 RepID=A0AAW1XM00_RUBAR
MNAGSFTAALSSPVHYSDSPIDSTKVPLRPPLQLPCAQTMGTQATTVQSQVDVVDPLRRRSPHAAAIIDLSQHEANLDGVQRTFVSKSLT